MTSPITDDQRQSPAQMHHQGQVRGDRLRQRHEVGFHSTHTTANEEVRHRHKRSRRRCRQLVSGNGTKATIQAVKDEAPGLLRR